MSLEILHFDNREDWLKGRDYIKGLGGSDAAAACGLSRHKSQMLLWSEKTGKTKPKNISNLDYVQMGVKTEGPMRELFAAMHPELEVQYKPFDIYRQVERPWCFATLDGDIRDRATGDRGILEIKKADCMNKADRERWMGRVPEDYFCQVLHQLAATNYEFAYLWALLRNGDGSCTLREYYFPREEYRDDLKELLRMETIFMDMVQSGRVPPAKLSIP